jgi:hypothetical protein
MIINIKVDTNDGDFTYLKSEVEENDIGNIKLMIDAISKFKPYKTKSKKYDLIHEHRHNFPNGGRYGFSMWRDDTGGKSPYIYYVKSKMVSEEVFNTFKKYVKERTFHTIHQIKLDKQIIFKKERW